MDRQPTQYEKILLSVLGKLRKLEHQLQYAIELSHTGQTVASFRAAFEAEKTAEKLTLQMRTAPAYTGIPSAKKQTEQILQSTVPIRIGYTQQGWFFLRIPCLLPKKEGGSTDYIRGFLTPAMDAYFRYGYPKKMSDCVLIYRHVYDSSIPERRWRDHDNIELNCVTDKVAQYVMEDDTPVCCRHYYCSAPGKESVTQVFVVPKNEFPEWLKTEENMSDEGPPIAELEGNSRGNFYGENR